MYIAQCHVHCQLPACIIHGDLPQLPWVFISCLKLQPGRVALPSVPSHHSVSATRYFHCSDLAIRGSHVTTNDYPHFGGTWRWHFFFSVHTMCGKHNTVTVVLNGDTITHGNQMTLKIWVGEIAASTWHNYSVACIRPPTKLLFPPLLV